MRTYVSSANALMDTLLVLSPHFLVLHVLLHS